MANLAHRAARTPIHTFTLAFEEQELNEAPFARKIAEAIGTEHREVLLTEGDFLGHLEGALDGLDQPTFDAINAYAMSRAIRAAGFTVALSGAGGDELFGGYSSFRDLPVLERWSRRLRFLPRRALVAAAALGTAPLRRSGGAVPPQTRWAKLPDMVGRGRRPARPVPARVRAVPPGVPARARRARGSPRRRSTGSRAPCTGASTRRRAAARRCPP